MKPVFHVTLPVQFRDLDIAGHVNHATYFQYMETARVEFLRTIGEIEKGYRPRVILASARAEYYRPIRNERQVTVSVWVSRIGNQSWDFDYTIKSASRVLHANGRTTQVAYNYEKNASTQITNDLRDRLQKNLGKPLKFRGEG